MHYVWDFGILSKYSHLFWLGLAFTILYTIGTIFLGTVIGLVVGLLRLGRFRRGMLGVGGTAGYEADPGHDAEDAKPARRRDLLVQPESG